MISRGGEWLANTRAGRTVFRVLTVGMVLGAAYAVIRAEVGRQTGEANRAITHRVTVIEEVSPYDVMLDCLRAARCRQLLEHPKRAQRELGRGGDALQTGSTGHQQPGPHGGGHHHGAGGSPGPESPNSAGGGNAPSSTSPEPTGSSAGGSSQGESTHSEAPPAKGTVEHAGDATQGAVEGVKETVGSAVSEVGAAAEGPVCGSPGSPGCSK